MESRQTLWVLQMSEPDDSAMKVVRLSARVPLQPCAALRLKLAQKAYVMWSLGPKTLNMSP